MKQNQTHPRPSPEPRPRRGLRLALATTAALGVLLVLASMIAPFFIPWDKLKAEAVAAGSKALGRELGIGGIEVSLFSGVHIKDLQLANAKGGFSDQALFSNADAKVDVSLLSLFTGKLVINSITFVKPQLLIETNAKGVSNLVGIGGAPTPARAATQPSAAAVATVSAGGETFPAVLLSLVIQDGEVVLRDRQKGTETAFHGLNVKVQGLSLAAAGASRLEVAMVAEVQGKKIPLSLVGDFKLDMAGRRVDISSMDLKAPALDATVAGSVRDFGAPTVDLSVGAELALDRLADLLPPSALAGLPPGLKTQGSLKLDLTVKGALADPKAMDLKGALRFVGVGAAVGDYPALGDMQGTLSFDTRGVDLPALEFKLGGDPATLALNAQWGDLADITGPVSALKAQVRYTLRSPRLNLDPILAAGSGATTTAASLQPSSSAPAAALPDYSKSVSRGLSVEGAIEVGSLVVRGFTTGKMSQRLVLKNQRITSATDLFIGQGRVYERSGADLSRPGPAFHSALGIESLDLHTVVDDAAAAAPGSQLDRLKGKVDGVLDVKAVVQGRGFAKPFVLDNTRATVDFVLRDAVIRSTDMQERMARVVPYPPVQKFLRSDLRFSNAVGRVVYAARRATLKSFTLGSGKDWRQGQVFVQAAGFADVGGGLDFKIVPRFNPSLHLLDGDLGRAFQDEKGWPTFDYIEYSGPSASQAKADCSTALQKAAMKAVAQHMDQITRAVGQALGPQAGGLLKKLPGGLNRLFGP